MKILDKQRAFRVTSSDANKIPMPFKRGEQAPPPKAEPKSETKR